MKTLLSVLVPLPGIIVGVAGDPPYESSAAISLIIPDSIKTIYQEVIKPYASQENFLFGYNISQSKCEIVAYFIIKSDKLIGLPSIPIAAKDDSRYSYQYFIGNEIDIEREFVEAFLGKQREQGYFIVLASCPKGRRAEYLTNSIDDWSLKIFNPLESAEAVYRKIKIGLGIL